MRRITRRFSHNLLLTDGGTLVRVFHEERDGVVIGQTAEVTVGYCEVKVRESYRSICSISQPQYGRIVIHDDEGFIKLAKQGRVEATLPNVDGGSENTKTRGLQVQYLWLRTRSGERLTWCDVVSLVASNFTPQLGADYKLPDFLGVGGSIQGFPVVKLTDLRKPEDRASAAAVENFETAVV